MFASIKIELKSTLLASGKARGCLSMYAFMLWQGLAFRPDARLQRQLETSKRLEAVGQVLRSAAVCRHYVRHEGF